MFTIGTLVKCNCGCNTVGVFQYMFNEGTCILRDPQSGVTFEMPTGFLSVYKKTIQFDNYVAQNPKNKPYEKN